jgi:Beta-glucosidase-related glycosidases
VTNSFEESAALAVHSGCDLNCGCAYGHIPAAVAAGLVREEDLDTCLHRLFRARMRLGMFDPPERVPYASTPYETNDCDRHRALARATASASMVLLKNEGGLLPLRKDLRSIAVIGPNAYDHQVLCANYSGTPSRAVTPLEGIRAAVSAQTKVWYAPGCKRQGTATDGLDCAGHLAEALSIAERAEAVVLCLGLSAEIEGEQGDASNSEAAGDKVDLDLPGLQPRLLESIVALGKPTVLVVVSGSALDLAWAHDRVGALIQAFYPGEEGGSALADILFGDVSPAGRLPVTFPRSLADVPDFKDYSMKGRTYRYLERPPLYPFGYGLSYTRFHYQDIAVSPSSIPVGGNASVSVTVKNVGTRPADEVVQLYLTDIEASCTVPHHSLRGFARVHLLPGEARRISFELSPRDLSLIDERGQRVLEPGRFRASVGGSQPDPRSQELTGQTPLSVEFDVVGTAIELPY